MTKSHPDRNLTKLKLALASGGLLATMIGAGLLGKDAAASAAYTASAPTVQTAPVLRQAPAGSRSQVTIDASIPPDLDLNLEAIPTVVAPVVRSAPVAMGRSSG